VPETGTLQPAEVVALMSKAAESGDPDSQNIFGGMFQTGAGVTKDPAAAAKWYLLSAESDNGYGQMNLGLLYLKGIGVDEDPAEARRWLEAAVRNGVEEARAQLNELR
jgi:TPR repeat protein